MIDTLQDSLLSYRGDADLSVTAAGYVTSGRDASGKVARTNATFNLEIGPSRRRGRLPLISCLMPTRNRIEQAKFAIAAYRAQTWPNRELVVLDQSLDTRLGNWIGTLHDPTIRYLSMPNLTERLGAIRNRTIDVAAGSLLCTWDDDDLYHPARLEISFAAMVGAGAGAAMLVRETLWAPSIECVALKHAEFCRNSLLVSRAARLRYPPHLHGTEDRPAVAEVLATQKVAVIDLPELYLYCVHGANTCRPGYFDGLWQLSTDRSEGRDSLPVLEKLSRAYPLAQYAKALGLGGEGSGPVEQVA